MENKNKVFYYSFPKLLLVEIRIYILIIKKIFRVVFDLWTFFIRSSLIQNFVNQNLDTQLFFLIINLADEKKIALLLE